MFSTIATVLAAASIAVAAPAPVPAGQLQARGGSISVTPHDMYASAIGVLGCKINTNRVAYWPGWPTCGNTCVKVTANSRSVFLLLVDSSGGAHDISYDAWNYLSTGKSALQAPTQGGGIPATWEQVPTSNCDSLILTGDGKLPLTAANGMNFYSTCPNGSTLWDILDPSACRYGVNVQCDPPKNGGNQPVCRNGAVLGSNAPLTSCPVKNIPYGTNKEVVAQ